MSKVLIVANSRKTRGGITSVLNIWEQMPFWKKYHCRWIETQINASIWKKLYYLFSSLIISIFIVPRYNIIHFHTTPGISTIVQMPIFLWSLLWRKQTIIQLHVGNQLLDYKDSKCFNFVLRHADKTIVLAKVWKDVLKNMFPMAHDVEVLYNPSPIVTLKSVAKENLVFYGAFLADNKGYDLLIKAFSRVGRKHPDWRLLMAVAGDTEKARQLIKENQSQSNIEMVEWLTPEEMEVNYTKAKIYCIASYKEGFPMSALECWAHGIPLVTTPVGGLVDVIVDKQNAMVFDFGDVDGLEQCLLQLIEDECLWAKIAEGSREIVENYFKASKINSDIENLYDSL